HPELWTVAARFRGSTQRGGPQDHPRWAALRGGGRHVPRVSISAHLGRQAGILDSSEPAGARVAEVTGQSLDVGVGENEAWNLTRASRGRDGDPLRTAGEAIS